MARRTFVEAISDFFRGRQKQPVEESVMVAPKTEINNEIISKLVTSNTTIFKGTLASNEDERKLMALYDQMDNDSVISAALDLYADNATQINPKTGHVVSIESNDKEFQKEINEFLWDAVKIDTEAWQITRDIAKYGKIALDTRADQSDWSFVAVEDPSTVQVLVEGQDNIKYFVIYPHKDMSRQEVGSPTFMYQNRDVNMDDYIIEQKDRFIVGFNSREIRGSMTLQFDKEYQDTPIEKEYRVRSGRSILAAVIQTWQTLSAMEDALFINRLTKSTKFKLVQVDVGDSNDKQATQIMNSVKSAFKSSESIDLTSNRYQNRQSPIAYEDYIYMPKKGEKGAIEVNEFGGEIGEQDLSDINYYRNKLFAGLGVLKAYLGFEETTPGGLGDSTLSKLDERFGRRVVRLQQVLAYVVNQMISYYWRYSLTDRTSDNIPKYKLVLGKISTKEEEENRKRLDDSINSARNIISLIKDDMFIDKIDKDKLFNFIMNEVIGLDSSMFDNLPSEDEIAVKVKEIKDELKQKKTIKKESIQDKTSSVKKEIKKERKEVFIPVKAKTHLSETYKDLYNMFDEFDIYLDDDKGTILPFNEAIKRFRYKRVFGEATYKQLKDMSKSKDPERLAKSKKLTAAYTGIDSDNNITFRVTAEDPEANRAAGRPTSYTTKVALNDLASAILKSRENGSDINDKDIVMSALQGDIEVSCDCPAAMYWGQQWNGTKDNYSLDKNDIAPTRNIPTQPICKHTLLTLTVLPFWWNSIVRDLRNKGILSSSETLEDKIDKKAGEEKAEDLKDINEPASEQEEQEEDIKNLEDERD